MQLLLGSHGSHGIVSLVAVCIKKNGLGWVVLCYFYFLLANKQDQKRNTLANGKKKRRGKGKEKEKEEEKEEEEEKEGLLKLGSMNALSAAYLRVYVG